MRVSLVSPSMGYGGAERLVAMLIAGLAERGHEVTLIAPSGDLDADLMGVPHRRVSLSDRGRDARGVVSATVRLARALAISPPQVIHAQNVKATMMARAASTVARPWRTTPLISTFHGVLPAEYARAARLLRTADHVVCVSGDLERGILAAGLPAARASVIENAVPLGLPLSPARRAQLDRELDLGEGPVVTIVGRLVPQKAHERFLGAARVIVAREPATRLLIVGDGPRREEIAARITALALDENVRMTGSRSDARELLARSDLAVFSSDWEGLSIAALEALAAGTPIVSTDVQGMHSLLADGAGAVVALDDGTALGEKVLALLGDPAGRARMGAVGRALIAREHSLERMVSSYELAYHRLLES